jgi:hypothetical protein
MTGIVVLIFRVLLVIALYGFLGVILISLWRQLMSQTRKAIHADIPDLVLEPLGFSSQRTEIHDRARVTIGRDPQCDLHFEDLELSSQHTCLSYHHRQWWVEDLQSTNGTYLNGQKITEPVVLVSQDIIRCGYKEWKIILENQESTR